MRKIKQDKKILVSTVLLANISLGYAAPTGGVVSSGQATINHSGTTTNINQATNRASINWQSFNIAPNETVNFHQPSSSSITLNRVVGTTSSLIQGAMNANGQVMLINPNGVLFSKGANINVGGLIASTLNITDKDFQDGNFNFEGTSQASIINRGTIKADDESYIALLGKEIINEGVIEVTKGTIELAGAKKVTLNLNGNSMVSLVIDEGMENSLVENKGMIKADGGKIFLTTKAVDDILDGYVINSGTVQAQTLEDITGHIELFAHGGTAKIDGTLDASAPNGGDGGFIETSGDKVKIEEGTKVTTKSLDKKDGKWLIDPDDYTIAASGGDMTGATLSSNLGNNNIVIESYDGGSGTDGDIHVNDAITWTSGNSLTLTAHRNININKNIDASGGSGGKLILKYGQGAAAAGNTATYNIADGASVSLQASTGGLGANSNFQTLLGSDFMAQPTHWYVITSLGTENSITGKDLQGISGGLTNSYSYVLGADIDASATSTWPDRFVPIGATYDFGSFGYIVNDFSGTFDGLGHTVSNITFNTNSDSIGLFASNTGTIRNIKVTTSSPLDTSFGNQIGGIAGTNGGTIHNSSFYDGTNTYTTEVGAGKLVGSNNGGTITNTFVSSDTAVAYTLSNILKTYKGSAYSLSDLWSTSDIFADAYSSWVYGTDYKFTQNNNYITIVRYAGVYSNIGIDILKSGFTEAEFPTLGKITINKAALSVTAADHTKTYDSTTYTGGNGVNYSGLVGSETSAVLGGTLSYGGNSQSAKNAGTYTITPSGLTSSNYDITFNNGSLTINKAPLSVAYRSHSETYYGGGFLGGNIAMIYDGFVGGEKQSVLEGTVVLGGDGVGAKDVGTYTVTVSGLTSNNYDITFNPATLTINPATTTTPAATTTPTPAATTTPTTSTTPTPATTPEITKFYKPYVSTFSDNFTRFSDSTPLRNTVQIINHSGYLPPSEPPFVVNYLIPSGLPLAATAFDSLYSSADTTSVAKGSSIDPNLQDAIDNISDTGGAANRVVAGRSASDPILSGKGSSPIGSTINSDNDSDTNQQNGTQSIRTQKQIEMEFDYPVNEKTKSLLEKLGALKDELKTKELEERNSRNMRTDTTGLPDNRASTSNNMGTMAGAGAGAAAAGSFTSIGSVGFSMGAGPAAIARIVATTAQEDSSTSVTGNERTAAVVKLEIEATEYELNNILNTNSGEE